MAIKFTQETEIEKEMIETLTSGDSQWNYHPEIRTEQALWDNFFDILYKNNLSHLSDNPLTEDEKSQIRTQLNFSSYYDAGVWLSGENGIAQVRVQRTDASLGTIHLMVHNANDIAGGSSVYQVINQLHREKHSKVDRNRRMDVTLLINGLPLIHIELKSRRHSINEAFEQIKKYDAEKKFSGLLSLTQIFIVSNGSSTEYIAANKHYRLDPNFLSSWVNVHNQPIRDLVGFTKDVLSIPMAHELVTDYTVLDSSSKTLITMRPYQIHATKAVLNAMKNDESGYVWHTTGSGKTLTSYKTSKTILRRMSLDKVLFLVDRKDLDAQTTGTFESYAQNDSVQVDGTDNVTGLVKALLRPQREVIITTAQKLNHLLKRYERDNLNDKMLSEKAQLRHLNLSFVVDECHRAVSSEQQRNIDRFFKQPVKLWYGFTGTPIFTQNKKTVKGDLDATTPEQYGRELHRYTVKEAIHDENVLSFHVEYVNTLDEVWVYEHLINNLKLKEDYVYSLSETDIEKRLTEQLYATQEHMLVVLEQVINRSMTKLGLHRGSGQTYSGILTVPSIERAQAYYKLFRQVLNGEIDLEIHPRIKKLLSDFPKIAITYSLSENTSESYNNQQVMADAIQDYNQLFGTAFTLETIDLYNQDLTNRLARKHEKYELRKEQLDLVIVVDRLLTGFDAPSLSTLFIDRPIMPEHTLIQAFSRTNRLYGNKKANIVTLRTPSLYKEAVREAIKLYSAGSDPDDVMAPTWEAAKQTMIECVEQLLEVFDSIDDVLSPSVSNEKKLQFAKAFQQVDKAFNDIQVYNEYIEESYDSESYLEDTFNISEFDLEHYHGLYVNVIEQLRDNDGNGETEFDVEYQLSTSYREEIDHNYILSLMDRHKDDGLSYDEEKEVDRYIVELSEINPKLGQLLTEVWNTIKTNPKLVEGRRAIDILSEYQDKYIDNVVQDLADGWLVPYDTMSHFVRYYNPSRDSHVGWINVQSKIRENYDSNHVYPAKGKVNSLRIRKIAEEHIFEVLNREIVPLKYR